ncbi:hypothetical protein Dimus_038652 [Dionaea muscipula]
MILPNVENPDLLGGRRPGRPRGRPRGRPPHKFCNLQNLAETRPSSKIIQTRSKLNQNTSNNNQGMNQAYPSHQGSSNSCHTQNNLIKNQINSNHSKNHLTTTYSKISMHTHL